MRPTLIILALVSVAFGNLVWERNDNEKRGCNADNCARAVTGTRNGPATVAAHKADCASFQEVTVYHHHTEIPTHVPAYASACSGTARYASACECFGFPVKTIHPEPHHHDHSPGWKE